MSTAAQRREQILLFCREAKTVADIEHHFEQTEGSAVGVRQAAYACRKRGFLTNLSEVRAHCRCVGLFVTSAAGLELLGESCAELAMPKRWDATELVRAWSGTQFNFLGSTDYCVEAES